MQRGTTNKCNSMVVEGEGDKLSGGKYVFFFSLGVCESVIQKRRRVVRLFR